MENSKLNAISKILICTIVDDCNNYGQRLQAYALCKFIKDNFNIDCRVCDYRKKTDESPSFSAFQKQLIPSVYAKSKEDIYAFGPDLVLLGSDQVLNHNIIDLRTHCHGILKDFKNISTYAAGEVGWSPTREPVNILTPNDKNKFAISLLSRCGRVSVRDESTVKALNGKISGRANANIDPVFLVPADDWRKIAEKPGNIQENEVFDFAYWICGQPKDVKPAEDVKTYVCIGQNRDKKRFSPQEFLWLVAHCRKLYTNSFHGCAFGLIFNKDMVLAKKDDRRIANLLDTLEAGSRDWTKVNIRIKQCREDSFMYLQDVIHTPNSIVSEYSKCSGCMACIASCPRQTIKQVDIGGFKYPKIDIRKCIGCGACRETCYKIHSIGESRILKTALAQCSATYDMNNSSSGGTVKAIAKYVVRNGGVSYGVVFAKDFKSCYFTRADNEDMLEFQTRSKYMEPSPPDYRQIKFDVASGRKVLFIGVPCQIAAVEAVIGKPENLITISLICHGMPSAEKWAEYLSNIEKRHSSFAVYVNHRYALNDLYITMLNGHVVHNPGKNEWLAGFVSGKYEVRDACYSCKFKYPCIPGDFIVGDSWGIDKKSYGFKNNKVGVIFCMSAAAERLFGEISQSLNFRLLDTDMVVQAFKKSNPQFSLPKKKPR